MVRIGSAAILRPLPDSARRQTAGFPPSDEMWSISDALFNRTRLEQTRKFEFVEEARNRVRSNSSNDCCSCGSGSSICSGSEFGSAVVLSSRFSPCDVLSRSYSPQPARRQVVSLPVSVSHVTDSNDGLMPHEHQYHIMDNERVNRGALGDLGHFQMDRCSTTQISTMTQNCCERMPRASPPRLGGRPPAGRSCALQPATRNTSKDCWSSGVSGVSPRCSSRDWTTSCLSGSTRSTLSGTSQDDRNSEVSVAGQSQVSSTTNSSASSPSTAWRENSPVQTHRRCSIPVPRTSSVSPRSSLCQAATPTRMIFSRRVGSLRLSTGSVSWQRL
mmetsp:Transcript_65651/g.173887  ORF Transcript_65651/g.173887 Transcript_65651/m.173887 type:complete len:330 (+) Transcript_65651:67-1056(+)